MASVKPASSVVAAAKAGSAAPSADAVKTATKHFADTLSSQMKSSVAQLTTAVTHGQVTLTVTSDKDRVALENALKNKEGLASMGLRGSVDWSRTPPRYTDQGNLRGGVDLKVEVANGKGWAAPPTTQRSSSSTLFKTGAQEAAQAYEAQQNLLWELSHSVASLSRTSGLAVLADPYPSGSPGIHVTARDANAAEALMKLLLGPKDPQLSHAAASGKFEATGEFTLKFSDGDRFKSGVKVTIEHQDGSND